MIYKKINLKDYFPLIKENDASLTCYCPDNFSQFSIGRKRKAIIVLPGGGYDHVSEREGEAVAFEFLTNDMAAFVLKYSVGDFEYPTPIDEVFAAILYVKNNAEELHVDENNIYLIGFSAGGHLAASTCLFHNDKSFENMFNVESGKLIVNGLILAYPVITMGEYTHFGTMEKRTKRDLNLIEKFSVEKHITKDFPKTFIWLTANDSTVPAYNSLALANELVNNNVTVELHMYPKGNHGLSLAKVQTCKENENMEDEYIQTWIDHAKHFINKY